jgi:hypothetical protein
MNTDTLSPSEAIDQMVSLRLQRAELDRQIDTLKPQFLEACADLNISQLRHEQALISRRLAPGKWDYPSHILEHEKQLKHLKQQFQETHEPAAGQEISWSIKLLT